MQTADSQVPSLYPALQACIIHCNLFTFPPYCLSLFYCSAWAGVSIFRPGLAHFSAENLAWAWPFCQLTQLDFRWCFSKS